MDCRIVDKEAFTVIGKSIPITCKDGENFARIPLFWQECGADGTMDAMEQAAPGEVMYGLCLDMDAATGDFIYMIAIPGDASALPPGWTARSVPAFTWAIFTSIGPMPHAIQNVTQRIFREWFPATGYEHAGGPEIEAYPPGDASAEDYRCEVWMPVVKKTN